MRTVPVSLPKKVVDCLWAVSVIWRGLLVMVSGSTTRLVAPMAPFMAV
jgi:hypothetical protein